MPTTPDAPSPSGPGTAPDPGSLAAYAESAIAEDAALVAARERAVEIGVHAVTPAVGAALCLFTRLVDARAVVEIGTGAGVSGLWLLGGMRPDGVLTTIDPDSEHHRAARAAFTAAGITGSRTRLITGRAADVLPRLADDSYDVVFVDGPVIDQPRYITEGLRLLRSGGLLLVHDATADGRIADPSKTDPETEAARQAALLISEDDGLLPVVIPLGRGLLAAARAAVPAVED